MVSRPLGLTASSSSEHTVEEFIWKLSRSLKDVSFPQFLGQEQQKVVLIFSSYATLDFMNLHSFQLKLLFN